MNTVCDIIYGFYFSNSIISTKDFLGDEVVSSVRTFVH